MNLLNVEPVATLIKKITLVIYDSSQVRYDSRVVNYERKMFIRLATDGCLRPVQTSRVKHSGLARFSRVRKTQRITKNLYPNAFNLRLLPLKTMQTGHCAYCTLMVGFSAVNLTSVANLINILRS